jgi:hypothetical protein
MVVRDERFRIAVRGVIVIDNARNVEGRLCRLKALLPGLLFVLFVVAFVGIWAAAKARSLFLTLACVAAVVATLAALAAWTLLTERFGQNSGEPPRHVAWHSRQWADFEHAFWSYVDGPSDAPSRAPE